MPRALYRLGNNGVSQIILSLDENLYGGLLFLLNGDEVGKAAYTLHYLGIHAIDLGRYCGRGGGGVAGGGKEAEVEVEVESEVSYYIAGSMTMGGCSSVGRLPHSSLLHVYMYHVIL